MKKLWTTLVIVGLVMLGATTLVSAQGARNGNQNGMNYQNQQTPQNMIQARSCAAYGNETSVGNMSGEQLRLQERIREQIQIQPQNGYPKARFRGIWGYVDNNTTQGYLGGVLGKQARVGYLRGAWNTTENASKGKIAGILRNGFFNGRYEIPEGASYRITGFYRVDRENKQLHIRWMNMNTVGWAHCRIGASEDSSSTDTPVD